MSFRLNFDLSFNFPPPPPRSGGAHDQSRTPPVHGHDNRIPRRGLPGWWQTARQHPHFALRIIYLVTAVIGFTLDNVLLANVLYWYPVIDLHQVALAPLIVGFFWQILVLCGPRLFPRRTIPNWLIALIETIGYLMFLALFAGSITDDRSFDTGRSHRWQFTLLTYDSAVWVALCLLNITLAVQCYVQGWRNVRPERATCEHCGSTHVKGKGPAAHDEEALGGSEAGDAEGEAGPSGHAVPEPYRDEVEREEGEAGPSEQAAPEPHRGEVNIGQGESRKSIVEN
ncbi:MAG: hypothetical protein Q9197_004843 [Variospora fuerteventurae]